MKLFFSSLVLLLLLFSLPDWSTSQTTQTALKTFISQNALTYMAESLVPELIQSLGSVSIPDISGKVDAPIGKIDYTLSKIIVSDIQIPNAAAAITSDGIAIAGTDMSLEINLDWSYQLSIWPHPGDHGTADCKTGGINVNLGLAAEPTPKGQISVKVTSSSLQLKKLDIHLHGGASWLYQIFIDVFEPLIRVAVQKELQVILASDAGDIINKILSTIPVSVQILKLPIELDYSLEGEIFYSPAYWLSAAPLGEFYSITDPKEAPFTKFNIPDIAPTRMFQLIASDFFINSALFSLYQTGAFSVTINPSQVPSWSPLQLNTSSFCAFSPGLCKTYPDEQMSLFFNATTCPSSQINQNGVNGTLEANLEFSVIEANKTQVPAFTIYLVAALNGTGYIVKNTELAINVNYNYGNFFLVSSEVGSVNVKLMQATIDLTITKVVMPIINKFFGQGIPLPSIAGISFVDPTISYNDHLATLATDIVYNATAL